jgi:hypothetical protein
MHVYNPSIWETEAGGLSVQGQPGLHNETLAQKPNQPKTPPKSSRNHFMPTCQSSCP